MLNDVMTIAEAARRWGFVPATLHRAIKEDRLKATRSEGTWLVTYADMVAVYGAKPQRGEPDTA